MTTFDSSLRHCIPLAWLVSIMKHENLSWGISFMLSIAAVKEPMYNFGLWMPDLDWVCMGWLDTSMGIWTCSILDGKEVVVSRTCMSRGPVEPLFGEETVGGRSWVLESMWGPSGEFIAWGGKCVVEELHQYEMTWGSLGCVVEKIRMERIVMGLLCHQSREWVI